MKVRKRLLPVVLLIQAVAILVLPMSAAAEQAPPSPSGTGFQDVFYYPNDTVTPNAEEDTVASFVRAQAAQLCSSVSCASVSPKPIINSTYVDIMGGPFGTAPQQLSYDAADTTAANGIAYSLNGGQGYDCYVDNTGTAQLSIPNNTEYWHIDYDMYVQIQSASATAPTFASRERIASITPIEGPNPGAAAAGGAGSAHPINPPGTVSDHSGDGLGAAQLATAGIPNQCLPDPSYLSHHGSFTSIPNYYQDEAVWPNITANPAGVGGSSGNPTDDACDSNAGALAWLLCPIIDLAQTAVNGVVQGVVIPTLQVAPLVPNNTNTEYKTWDSLRLLANVLFVIIFLVIIFANTLQFNLNAYTIKKMLPRLVAAVVLVQFSFILSAALVDIGNVLGQGITSLLDVVLGGSSGGGGGGSDLAGALSGIVAGSVIAVIGIPTVMIAMLTALISAIAVLVTLVARQLILIILVIVSPLAFAAWVLPGTERYFSIWLKMFVRVVLMYPMIVLLISAANLGSSIVGNGSSQGIEQLLAAILPIIAFFMIPMTFKWAGGAMAGAGSFINKRASGITSSKGMQGLRKGARERQTLKNQGRAAGFENASMFGKNIPGSRRVMTGLGRIGTGRVMPGSRTKSDIALAAQRAMGEESKRVESLNLGRGVLRALSTGDSSALSADDKRIYNQHKDLTKTYTGRAAAANQLAKQGDVEGLEAFRQRLQADKTSGRLSTGQATQLWNGAKSGAGSELRKQDAVLAASGWADSEYTGAALQQTMERLGGEDIANMQEGRLAGYAGRGAKLSAAQIQVAGTDKNRLGKSGAHQAALHQAATNGGAVAAGGAAGQTERDVDFERLVRFDSSSGAVVARSDREVNEIRKHYNQDPSYRARVDTAVSANLDIPAP